MLIDEAWEEHLYALEPGQPGFEAALDLGLERPPDLRRAAGCSCIQESRAAVAAGERPQVKPRIEAARGPSASRPSPQRPRRSALSPARRRHRLVRSAAVPGRTRSGGRNGARQAARHAPWHGAGDESARSCATLAKEGLADAQLEIFEWLWRSGAQWLAGVRQRYDRLAAERSLIDFDRQIAEAVDLLRDHPEVRAALAGQFPVILIDEFQDTDRQQIELARLLAGGAGDGGRGPRSLFVVGDPKQSIYRFRAADLENYRRFVEDVPPESLVRLTQSFRAAPALAAWVNAEMGRIMERSPIGPPYEVDYSPLVAAPGYQPPEESLSGVVQLQIAVESGWRVEQTREAEADALARMARALVVGERGEVRGSDGRLRPAQWGDLALLLPRLTILEPYEAALRRHEVPYRTEAGRAYYRRDETHALGQVLRALADPGDSVAVVAALRGPGFGCSDHDLTAYALAVPRPRFDLAARPGDPGSSPDPAAAARTAAALERLRALRAEVRGWPLPELVQAAIDRLGLQSFYRLQWRGEQRLANLDKAVELARRFEELGQPSLQGFVRWLSARGEGEFDEGDAPAIERSQDAVRVLTVHKAKGLEFPIVLFGGLVGRGTTGGFTDRLQIARQRGGEEPGRLEAKVSKGSTRGFDAAMKSEEDRERAERKRLLYVAVTRARDLLVLPWLPGSSNVVDLYKLLYTQGGADWEGSPLARRWQARDLPPGAAPEIEPPLVERVLEGPATEPPSPILSFPQPAAELPPAARGAIARAERRGRAAHALLSAALTGGPAPDLLELDEAERLAARESARRFLASPLGRRASAATDRLVETPLAVAVEGRARDLRLDLAFREGAGWVLVDYKNDREGARSAPERAAALRAQLAGYAALLERLTGVPVSEAHLAFLITGETRRYGRPELAEEPA